MLGLVHKPHWCCSHSPVQFHTLMLGIGRKCSKPRCFFLGLGRKLLLVLLKLGIKLQWCIRFTIWWCHTALLGLGRKHLHQCTFLTRHSPRKSPTSNNRCVVVFFAHLPVHSDAYLPLSSYWSTVLWGICLIFDFLSILSFSYFLSVATKNLLGIPHCALFLFLENWCCSIPVLI